MRFRRVIDEDHSGLVPDTSGKLDLYPDLKNKKKKKPSEGRKRFLALLSIHFLIARTNDLGCEHLKGEAYCDLRR